MFLTKRLRLRAFGPTDNDDLVALFNNQEAVTLFNGHPPIPRHRSLERMQSLMADDADMFCVIELRDTPPNSGLIGFASFDKKGEPRDQDTQYAIALHPNYWNKGYGTEITEFMVNYAFHSLNMHRISLGVFAENGRATAVYKKLGFVEEARLRKARWINGAWEDTILMSILRDEWMEKRGGIYAIQTY